MTRLLSLLATAVLFSCSAEAPLSESVPSSVDQGVPDSVTDNSTENAADYLVALQRAKELAAEEGEAIWTGFASAPFGVLLIDGEDEFLFCHDGEAEGFEPLERESILDCPAKRRDAQFPPNMLASFPAVDGVPTIVIGTPGGTGLSLERWTLTVLHEHFHQMQYSFPDYYSGTAALDLAGGDETGMWMLDYAFPYEDPSVASAFDALGAALLDSLDALEARDAGDTRGIALSLESYWQRRESARALVSESDWRYLELQLWQEGVARWTELAIGEAVGPLGESATEIAASIRQDLSAVDLAERQRTAVYSFGAGEAMLLEALDPSWKHAYWAEPFALGPVLKRVMDAAQ